MAWTTPRTWVAGEIVTAALMNTHVRDNENVLVTCVVTADGSVNTLLGNWERSARTTANVTVTSSTVMVNVTGLTFAVGSSEKWMFRFVLHANGPAAAAMAWQLTTPSLPDSYRVGLIARSSAGIGAEIDTATGASTTLTNVLRNNAAAIDETILIEGFIYNGASSGSIQLKVAQNVSTSVALTVYQNSHFIAKRLS